MKLVLLLVLLTAPFVHAAENCPAQLVRVSSPEVMSAALCAAADDGRLQPSSESLMGNCGVGARAGLNGFVQGFVNLAVTAVGAASSAKATILSMWTGTGDVARASEAAAEANARASKTWLATAREYYAASQTLTEAFFSELDDNARLVGSSLACLPWKMKMEYICQFFTHASLELVTVKKVVEAGNGIVEAHKAVRAFMKETNMVEGLNKLSFAERLPAVAAAARDRLALETVERFGVNGNLKKGIDPITHQPTLQLEEFAVIKGEKISVLRPIFRDAKTLAIDSNEVYGRRLAELTVAQSKGNMLLFGDLGNLGKVNYFKNGTASGDLYLKHVGEAIRSSLRSEDRFFKNGGDELVVVLKTKNPEAAKEFVKRVYAAIQKDATLQRMFKEERIAARDKIIDANTAKSTGGFEPVGPPSSAQVKEIQQTAKIRPNISFGMTEISGDWTADVARADKQASQVKAQYKYDIGLETDKYGIDENQFRVIDSSRANKPNFTAQPQIPDPVLLPH